MVHEADKEQFPKAKLSQSLLLSAVIHGNLRDTLTMAMKSPTQSAEDPKRMAGKQTIDEFDQTNRNILEQGINLLQYGFNADEIKEFLKAGAEDTELADFIIEHMSIWGPGLGYEQESQIKDGK